MCLSPLDRKGNPHYGIQLPLTIYYQDRQLVSNIYKVVLFNTKLHNALQGITIFTTNKPISFRMY